VVSHGDLEGIVVDDAIAVENLLKHYGKSRAINGISFSVSPGTIFGFLGPNGAGKTTTVKILTCQMPPTSGTAHICGLDVMKNALAIKRKAGVVFESQNLYEEMTAADNLDFFRRLYGAEKKVVDEVLELTGMAEFKKKKVKTFSKGMKQKIMIARALVNDPEVLFLDEPSSGLDPKSSRDIRQLIMGLKNKGKTILLTTHNMEEADSLCDDLAFIYKGNIIARGTPKYLKKKYGSDVLKIETLSGRIIEHPLNTESCSRAFSELSASGDILTVHSEEATLEDVFIELTGERLSHEL
jgi:ABC-2 type transport system ATP-binding protein